MNDKINNSTEHVCCICLKTSDFLENVHNVDKDNVKYNDKLRICSSDQIWYSIYKICQNCIDLLNTSYKFILTCIKHEEQRKNCYNLLATQPFKCYECSKTFKQEARLKKHITDKHVIDIKKIELKDEPAFDDVDSKNEEPCEDLVVQGLGSVKVDEPDMVDIKNIEHFSDNEYSDINNVTESENNKRKAKYKSKKRRAPHKCFYCDQAFTSVANLRKHTHLTHDVEKPFKCDDCDASYKTYDLLKVHKRSHTGELPYVCPKCGKAFKSTHGLFVHNQLHNTEKSYKCALCPKAFKTQAHLRTHRVGVHARPEDLKYECGQCGHKFPFKGHLTKHMMRHAGVKNYPCKICGKLFVTNSDAQLHIKRTHRNEDFHACKQCDKTFKSYMGYFKHLKISHDLGEFQFPKAEKRILCPHCPKMFAYNHKLQRHILTHTGEKPVKCGLCSKGFRDRTDLKTHLKNVHKIIEQNNGYIN